MLVKNNKSRAVEQAVREAWRNDVRLQQAMDSYRALSKMTIEEVLDHIGRDIALGRDPVYSEVNAVILRAAEVYREVTDRSPRTVGTDADTGPPLGENPFIALIANLFEEEGLKSPSGHAITRVLRKKPIKKASRNRYGSKPASA